ncbi:hypothetical protein [Ralstonia pseudosolanacearum]|uniref:hypothetical protein n=1 Tax=Ralstonia pseudosolanacearum TaxID=1310165 RepID=UPI002675A620|nr:hypothetical protein [Ralstonia pseudosolanacearum]MDO3560953.1 hypothetical protein [Ralstonia pseudosolanacearum]MDO3570340.1 hypothetical protein [Ralstonia pseudosolanacearum]
MTLSIADFPSKADDEKLVDLGGGLTGILTLGGYSAETPIYTLSINGGAVFSGTAEQVMAQVAHYRANRTFARGPRYVLKEGARPTPFGDRTYFEWILENE